MYVRVTSALFVAALVRRVQAGGGFAYVSRRGNDQAGAIFVAFVSPSTGACSLYAPAPPSDEPDDPVTRDERAFVFSRELADSLELSDFIASETRFDPDFWLIEIENWTGDPADLLAVSG